MLRKILVFLLIVLIIIQFIHPEKNINTGPQPNALAKAYPVPAEVDTILKHACYDCHSNNTSYPWYSNVQPSAWFLAKHVKDGKRHFNFDEFMSYTKERQDHKLKEFVEMVEEGDMPLSSYTWLHEDARLTPEQRKMLSDWAKELKTKIAQQPGS